MKYVLFFLLISLVRISYAQNTHSVLVNINQPETCVTTQLAGSFQEIKVFPNPSNHHVSIESRFQINRIAIVDTTGKLAFEKELKAYQLLINTVHLKAGIYQCVIEHSNGMAYSKLIIN